MDADELSKVPDYYRHYADWPNRLVVTRELLTESGSCLVHISDEADGALWWRGRSQLINGQ